ncbi:MAG: WD40 repeat domain-containing serine/threonine protein kinase, partial [Planctomycetota bacterium]
MNGSGVISQLKEAEFRLDRVCRQFEQAWRQNRPLTIEHCLLQVEVVERPHLLEELIASEWELRVRRGDDPDPEEYAGRFPQDEELVAAVCGVLIAEFANSPVRGSNTTPQPGEHLGDYKIIREIGRGGMGIVYEARQESLGRQVALKVLPARRFRSERELHRFQREAQAVARLHHSHIVEIYGVGEQDGVHYFAMRHVTGRGLDQVIATWRERLGLTEAAPDTSVLNESEPAGDGGAVVAASGSSLNLSRIPALPPDSIDSTTASSRYRAVARIGYQVAEALQYAHERGIQHRDVKPSNLLIDRQEVVWLSDFGLAKLDLEAADITESDDLIGTLKYMPPEALTGKIDHRSDIYSLGLTLYELITWQPALDGSDRAQLLEQVKDPQIAAPRWLAPDVPRDLETIILKAMARDLDHRYQSARDLADDLQRFLDHEPIRARPQSLVTKFRRWVERKPLMAFLALGTLSITSTSVYSFGALYLNAIATAKQARQDRDLANQMLQIAEQAKTSSEQSRRAAEVSTLEAQNRLIQAQRAEAAAYLQQGDDFAALAWTAETLRSQQRLDASSGAVTKEGHDHDRPLDAAGYLALEPALRLRVGAIMQGSPRVVLREWLPKLAADTNAGEFLTANGPADFRVDRGGIWFAANELKGDSLQIPTDWLCVSNPQRTRLWRWNLVTGQHEKLIAGSPAGASLFTKNGRHRLVYGADRTLRIGLSHSAGDAALRSLQNPPGTAGIQLQAAWESPNENWLLVSFRSSADEIQAGLWDLTTGQLAHPDWLPITGQHVQAEFSSDSLRLLVKSDRQVQILEVPTCQSLLPDEKFTAAASGWSRDGRWFAGQVQGQIQVYQVGAPSGSVPQVFESPLPKELSFQDNGGWLALMLPRGRVTFYEQSAQQTFNFQDSVHPHEIDAQGFSYSPDGQWYALAHEDGNVRVWSIHNHQPWTGILRHPGAVRSLCWSPAGDFLVTSTQNGLLTVWDLTPRVSDQILFQPDAVSLNNVRFSPDGSRIAVADERGRSRVWAAAEDGQGWLLCTDANSAVAGMQATVCQLPPGPASRDLPSSDLLPDETHRQRLEWAQDGASEAVTRLLFQHQNALQVQISPHSDHAAIFDAQGQISVSRVSDGQLLRQWPLPPDQHVAALTFNFDGSLLAIAGQLGLQVWETDSGKLVTPPFGPDRGAVHRVCFSPDGRHVATVSENHVCQIRDTATWNWRGAGFQLESRPV